MRFCCFTQFVSHSYPLPLPPSVQSRCGNPAFINLLNNLTGTTPVLPASPPFQVSASSRVQSWREIHHQTDISQQVSRSRSESQTSAGDICPSFSVELRAQTVPCPFPSWLTSQYVVRWRGEMICLLWSSCFIPHVFFSLLFITGHTLLTTWS